MAQLRHHHNGGATAIPWETLQDGNLSFTARGVLGYALSLPAGWDFSAERVAASCNVQVKGSGKAAVLSAFKELESAGYRRLVTEQDERGRFRSYAEFSFAPVPEWIEEAADKAAAAAQRKKRGPKQLSPAAAAAAAAARERGRRVNEEPQVNEGVLAFPQVAPEVGKPESGKSTSGVARVSAGRTGSREAGIRVPAFLRETSRERKHTQGQDAVTPPESGGSGPVCVDEFQEDAKGVILGAIDQEANLRLDRPDRDVLVARITVLIQRGWTPMMLHARLSGRTNSGTRRPDIILGRALDTLEAEEPPTGRSQADKAQVLDDALERARCLFDDNEWQLTRITTWLNRARLTSVATWMEQSDDEIRAQAAAEQELVTQQPPVIPVQPQSSTTPNLQDLHMLDTSELRELAAQRAVELGMDAELAGVWAAERPRYKLLPWLKAAEDVQQEALQAA